MGASKWIVVENTPGYMPDDDDPYVTDDYRDALRYMVTLVRESRDFSVDGGADIGGWLDREAGAAFLVDEGRPHDLGRYFEVMPLEAS